MSVCCQLTAERNLVQKTRDMLLQLFGKEPCPSYVLQVVPSRIYVLTGYNETNSYYAQGNVLELFCEKCQNAVCIMCVFQTGQEVTSTCHS